MQNTEQKQEERGNMITTKNKIGYIQRRYDENNVPHFKFIVAKIKRVNIGVKSTKVYTKEFYPLDLEDLESTYDDTDCKVCSRRDKGVTI